MSIRIIPRLDIKGPNLVKGISFEGLRVLGKPDAFARHYYEHGADELIYMDTVASLYGRNSLLDIVRKTAGEIFIPLTVGGGLRGLDDIRQALRAGADKVAINTAALADPRLVHEASRAFGASTIMVSIEAIRHADGRYEAYVDYGRQATGRDVFEWAREAVDLGAGELMVTSINNDGTGKGFDAELIRRVADLTDVPVIAGGGAGRSEDLLEVARPGAAQAVALASLLHYHYVAAHPAVTDDYSREGNTTFLARGASSRIKGASIAEVKSLLLSNGVPCRPCPPRP